jgi:hypothetical protein
MPVSKFCNVFIVGKSKVNKTLLFFSQISTQCRVGWVFTFLFWLSRDILPNVGLILLDTAEVDVMLYSIYAYRTDDDGPWSPSCSSLFPVPARPFSTAYPVSDLATRKAVSQSYTYSSHICRPNIYKDTKS